MLLSHAAGSSSTSPEYQPMAYFSSDVDEDPAAWLSNIHGTYSTDAVPGDAAEG